MPPPTHYGGHSVHRLSPLAVIPDDAFGICQRSASFSPKSKRRIESVALAYCTQRKFPRLRSTILRHPFEQDWVSPWTVPDVEGPGSAAKLRDGRENSNVIGNKNDKLVRLEPRHNIQHQELPLNSSTTSGPVVHGLHTPSSTRHLRQASPVQVATVHIYPRPEKRRLDESSLPTPSESSIDETAQSSPRAFLPDPLPTSPTLSFSHHDLPQPCVPSHEDNHSRIDTLEQGTTLRHHSFARQHASAAVRKHACDHCGSTSQSLWKLGPNGPRSLCGSCGAKWSFEQRQRRWIGESQPEQDGPGRQAFDGAASPSRRSRVKLYEPDWASIGVGISKAVATQDTCDSSNDRNSTAACCVDLSKSETPIEGINRTREVEPGIVNFTSKDSNSETAKASVLQMRATPRHKVLMRRIFPKSLQEIEILLPKRDEAFHLRGGPAPETEKWALEARPASTQRRTSKFQSKVSPRNLRKSRRAQKKNTDSQGSLYAPEGTSPPARVGTARSKRPAQPAQRKSKARRPKKGPSVVNGQCCTAAQPSGEPSNNKRLIPDFQQKSSADQNGPKDHQMVKSAIPGHTFQDHGAVAPNEHPSAAPKSASTAYAFRLADPTTTTSYLVDTPIDTRQRLADRSDHNSTVEPRASKQMDSVRPLPLKSPKSHGLDLGKERSGLVNHSDSDDGRSPEFRTAFGARGSSTDVVSAAVNRASEFLDSWRHVTLDPGL
ncbi:MAG: hypothetical protein M1828_003945 [Chrysothrix sp. TS-e1954]|nr:MAG: hypothetical protein M1828_003945 [Chrysothrix sp. TS-e1954]